MKQHITVTVDAYTLSILRLNKENISLLIDGFLKSYINTKSSTKQLWQLQKEIDAQRTYKEEIDQKLMQLTAELSRVMEDEKKLADQREVEAEARAKAVKASGIMHDMAGNFL